MQNSKPAAVLPHTPATELAQLSSLAKTATMQMLHNLQLHNLLEQRKC
jgi:DNA-binding IclR family transcriptional regulator